MTQNEFQMWVRWHGARFPQWASWLAGADQRSAQAPGIPTGAEVVAAIYDVLGDVRLDDAKTASTALAKGDETPPKAFEEHPTVVRAISRRRASDRLRAAPRGKCVNGEPTYECPRCQDGGLLTAWHPKTMTDARKNPEGILNRSISALTCAVACTCHKGCRMKDGGMLQVADWMIVLTDYLNWPTRLQELVDHMAAVGGERRKYDFSMPNDPDPDFT